MSKNHTTKLPKELEELAEIVRGNLERKGLHVAADSAKTIIGELYEMRGLRLSK